jgi:biotin-(acetyl-CoA carboxylase) ligase
MIVGLGINLTTTNFPEGLRAPAASLFSPEEANAVPADFPDTLAGEIAKRLLELADPNAAGEFPHGAWGKTCLDFYRRRLLYVGETVVCTRGSESFSGTLRGVDGDYSLLVETDSGILPLSSGEISVRPVRNC